MIRGKYSRYINKLEDNGRIYFTNDQKAEIIANCFENNHNLTINFNHSIDSKVMQKVNDSSINLDVSTYCTPSEVKCIIKTLKNAKAFA